MGGAVCRVVSLASSSPWRSWERRQCRSRSAPRQPAFGRCPRRRGALITLQTRLRYTTMIVLPEGEEILDVICGDKDFWVITSTQNIAHVKPAKEGAATNLNR